MLSEEQVENIKGQLKEQIEKLPEEQRGNALEWVEAANAEQIEEFLKQQQSGVSGGECLFCGIAKGTVDTIKVYENAFVAAFLDITPAAAGQTIIIPKEHYQFIFQMPDQILWEMARVMKLLTPLIVNITKAKGISIYIAQGPAAGQRIAHAAINLIPRFEDDKAAFAWERKEVDKTELEKAAKEIKIGIEKSLAEERAKIEKKLREEAEKEEIQTAPSRAVPRPEIPKAEKKLPEAPRRMP